MSFRDEPSPFRSPIRFARRAIRDWFGESESMRSEQSAAERVVSILTFPFRFLFASGVFMVNAWTTNRNGFAFIRAIPAVTVATFFFGLWWLSDYRFERYVSQTKQRFELMKMEHPSNPENWEIFANRWVEMKPESTEAKFNLAITREKLGDVQSARTLMNLLAGDEKNAGMANANVWLALDYQSRQEEFGFSDEEVEENTIRQFTLALESEPENHISRVGLADVYERKGDLDSAASHLSELVKGELRTMLQLRSWPRLIEMQQKLGNEAIAQKLSESAIKRLERLALRYPEMFDLWFVIVRCATLAGDFDQAQKMIDTGFQLSKDAKVREDLIRLLADTWIIRADKVESIDDKEGYRNRLFALCEAIKTNPRSSEAYQRLIEYATPASVTREKALWLRDSILGCPNPAVIHVILGMQEINDGDYVQGQKHWKIADQQFDLSQFIVNNLIEIAVSEKSEDFGNLLDMITVAMELFPDQAALYQTRGLYYKNKGEFKDAIKDLTYTIERLPSLISSRQMLLESYQGIGDIENAHKVQSEIDRMVSELNEEQRVVAEKFLEIQRQKNEDQGGDTSGKSK